MQKVFCKLLVFFKSMKFLKSTLRCLVSQFPEGSDDVVSIFSCQLMRVHIDKN